MCDFHDIELGRFGGAIAVDQDRAFVFDDGLFALRG